MTCRGRRCGCFDRAKAGKLWTARSRLTFGALQCPIGQTADGRCTCGAVRYRLNAKPLIVHCCHCTWCQREVGLGFRRQRRHRGVASRIAARPAGQDDAAERERQGAGFLALRRLRRHGVEQLSAGRPAHPFHPRRHARGTLARSARHPHLHVNQAALGDPAGRRARRARVL